MVQNNVSYLQIKKILPYIAVLILVFVSGNPVVSNRYVYPVLGLAGMVYLAFRFKEKDVRILAVYIGCLLLLFLGQWLVLGSISVLGSANYICKLIFGAAVFIYAGKRFRGIFFDLMTVISAVSLVFYIFQIFGIIVPRLFPTASDYLNSVLIHNVNIARDEYLRNCGPFWEPGAYAGFLFLSFLLYLDNLKDLLRRRPVSVSIVILTLISTRSTGAYIFLALLVGFYLIAELKNKKWWYYLIVASVAAAVIVLFLKTPFLGDKIKQQLNNTKAQMEYENLPEYSGSRTGSLVVDLFYVGKHPIVGNGFPINTRFAYHVDDWAKIREGHSNGFSNLFAQFGIPVALLYFILLFIRIPFSRLRKWAFLILYILLLQEEMFLNFPLFISLPFVVIPNRHLKSQNICNHTFSPAI